MEQSAKRPTVLFVCVHNAGRSQMAAGFLRQQAGGLIDALSAGSEPADQVNPAVVAAMREKGVDISNALPRLLSESALREADVVITMGCGDTCPVYPGKRYEDWDLADPAGKSLAEIRPIRDEIESRVQRLVFELISGAT